MSPSGRSVSRGAAGASGAPPRVIEVTRGGLVESRHLVHAAASDGEHRVAAFGDGERLTYYRSASKAFQAWPLVESGAASRFSLGPRELAIACGSHTGTPAHTSTVARMLERGRLSVVDLQCGVHPPRDEETLAAMLERGEVATALHHNCSGKHSGMLLRCVHEGWPTDTYLDPAHPHQVHLRSVVAGYAGVRPEEVPFAIDGCSAPVFAVTLAGMARSFAALAQGRGPDGRHSASAAHLRDAILACPEMVGGPGRLDTEFMRAAAGEYVVKVGAEGVYGVGHIPTGLGLAFKVEDGTPRAVAPALFDLLQALGWSLPAGLERFARPALLNFRDRVVGEIRAVGDATVH